MSYYQILGKSYSSFIEYLQILSGGKIDDVFYYITDARSFLQQKSKSR